MRISSLRERFSILFLIVISFVPRLLLAEAEKKEILRQLYEVSGLIEESLTFAKSHSREITLFAGAVSEKEAWLGKSPNEGRFVELLLRYPGFHYTSLLSERRFSISQLREFATNQKKLEQFLTWGTEDHASRFNLPKCFPRETGAFIPSSDCSKLVQEYCWQFGMDGKNLFYLSVRKGMKIETVSPAILTDFLKLIDPEHKIPDARLNVFLNLRKEEFLACQLAGLSGYRLEPASIADKAWLSLLFQWPPPHPSKEEFKKYCVEALPSEHDISEMSRIHALRKGGRNLNDVQTDQKSLRMKMEFCKRERK